MPQSAWATTDDVATITGKTVTAEELAAANSVLELVVGRIYTEWHERIGPRDTEYMRRAVAAQAVWQRGQPDFWERMDVKSIGDTGQGGSINLRDTALILAPLARIAIHKLTWRKSRSVVPKSTAEPSGAGVAAALSDAHDDSARWRPTGR